jgi:hypothetical protein
MRHSEALKEKLAPIVAICITIIIMDTQWTLKSNEKENFSILQNWVEEYILSWNKRDCIIPICIYQNWISSSSFQGFFFLFSHSEDDCHTYFPRFFQTSNVITAINVVAKYQCSPPNGIFIKTRVIFGFKIYSPFPKKITIIIHNLW